ncbi:MAG: Eco57I restriction-modification methylase domain-containing protein [Dehalococcoidia bacterium]|nr:Eco57I restriction-modification methylase domain-containing protein [Dehalococcoidia bacterium]
MTIERLTESIGRAVHQAEFTNFFKQRFESSVMHELYARKRRREYGLPNTDAIGVPESTLTDIVSDMAPMVAPYTSRETGAIGNGFYTMLGSQASPRLPSMEDYANNPSPPSGEDAPNFHTDRLRPLFFGGLNNYESRDATTYAAARALFGDVPFLNGGLFDRMKEDELHGVFVPDGVIRSIFEDLFERFNFTVMESTPFDIEVAVDPEMLGKVFEELVTGRHDSGAYLLGMMQELVELQTELYNVVQDGKSLYELKLQIIERNLYGADLDQFAVNIAMLRLWLSLSIEYDDAGDPPPLPNLEFKIVRGDSLLGPDPNPTLQANMFTEAIRNSKLGALKAEYMRENRPGRKPDLRQRIADAESQLRDTLGGADAPTGSVDWRIQFAEVIGRGGFDVAVANPPYIHLRRHSARMRQLYMSVGFTSYARMGDIYQLFYERGCQLLKPRGGLLAYITSNSWLRAEYGKSTRRYFSAQHTPLRFLDLGKDVFDSAIVDSGVLLLRKDGESAPFSAVDMDKIPDGGFPPDRNLWGQIRPDGESPWSVLSDVEWRVMDKMQAFGTPLKEWDVNIHVGMITGYNKAFIIDNQTKEALVAEDPKSAEIIKPLLEGV